jgi:hypothetical protein
MLSSVSSILIVRKNTLSIPCSLTALLAYVTRINQRKISIRFIAVLFMYLEPVSGAAPKVPPTAKITVLSIASRSAMVMLCQAQAHPLPVFRYADIGANVNVG